MNYWKLILTKHLNNGRTLPEILNHTKTTLHDKLQNVNAWYTKTTGLDRVQECQERVTVLQKKLLDVQENRRTTGTELNEMRRKSNELQEQIRNLKRHEEPDKFINLMREDTSLLRVETDLQKQFIDLDRQEREIFTAFTNAVRDSHEKQRWQLEYTKYLGYGLSITGSLLAYLYATLFRENLKHHLEKQVNLVLSRLDDFDEMLYQITQKKPIIVQSNQPPPLPVQPSQEDFVTYLDSKPLIKYCLFGCLLYISLKILAG